MTGTTPLSRPANPQVNVNSNPLQSLSDGFNYPTFRLLNNKSRVTLSPKYLSSDPAFTHQNFSVTNKKGWFSAIQNASSFGVILSPLSQLKSSVKSCSGEVTHFEPQRILSFSTSEPNIVAFACNDTRLIVGFKSGELVAYDTASILTQGSNEISPLSISQHSTSPPIQIQPNHSSDPALADFVAVVRKDGNVELLNSALERQHGWHPGDVNSMPVAASWSPKGKQLAIGLALGDIMTFAVTNRTTYQRHIPPTADGILVSLNWLAPGHTFRTSYSPATPGSDDPIHHIVHQDAKTSPVQFTNLDHSYQAPDRTKQSAYVVVLPKWDEDHTNPNADETKLLVIVGDVSCTDIEILGNQGTQWYQQVQDNPVSIPLDKNTEDTVLLSLNVDLTDIESGYPVVYAYLNDGTVQAWYVDGSKIYAGLVSSEAVSNASSSTASTASSAFGATTTQTTPVFGQTLSPQSSSPFGQTASSTPTPFGVPSNDSTFGQSPFGQSSNSSSTFGGGSSQTSPFGQSASPFNGAPQQTSSFGESQPQSTSPFGGQSSSTFGSQTPSSSAFGGGSTFGQSSFGQPAFGQSSFGQNTGGFGNVSTSNAGSTGGTFGSFGTTTTSSPFGGSFGAPAPSGAGSPPITRDDSMGDSTPSFGGLSLGSSDNDSEKKSSGFGAGGGMFGSAASQPSASSTSAFGSSDPASGGLIKPASGFGAFSGGGSGSFGAFGGGGGTTSTTSAFSGGAFSAKPTTTTTPLTAHTGGSTFGQSSFGQSSFGKPSFGQSGFSQPAFGKPAQSATPTSAGGSGGGFAAFASGGTTGFGTAAGGKSAFGGGGETSGVFGGAKPSETSSAFGDKRSESKPSIGFGAFSNQPSAFGATASSSSSTGGAFGSKPAETSSGFGDKSPVKPASGFGAATTPSAPGSWGVTGTSGQSPFTAATSDFASKPTSETTVKAAGLADPLSPSPSPPPTASHSTSTTAPSAAPAPGIGAFSNLTRSTFKPAEGFGAFGSTVSSDSPFFKAANEKQGPAVTAFSISAGTSSATPSSSASPAFGSTSKLGSGFGQKAAVSTSPAPPAFNSTSQSGGGFSAFSSGTSAFGSFASGGQKTSFGDLLKSGGDEQKKNKGKEEPSTEQKVKIEDDIPKGEAKEREASSTPTERSLTLKDESDPVTPKAPSKALNKDVEPNKTPSVFGSSVFTPPTPQEKEKPQEPVTPPSEDACSSQASSYVDIRKSEAGGSEEGSDVEHPPDDDDGFLSSDGSQPEEEDESAGEEHPTAGPPPPTEVPLPRSRSGTPQAEALKKHVEEQDEEDYDDDYEDEEEEEEEEVTEDEEDAASDSSRLSTIKEESESNTPPGSPTKKNIATPQPTSVIASPVPAAPSSSLGIGRPSTRPSRSSPLAASAPLSGYDEDAEATTPKAKEPPQLPAIPKPRLTSPKPPFSVLLPASQSTSTDETKTKRPKTPPLLSNFGLGGNSAVAKPLLGQSSPFTLPPPSVFGQPSSSSTASLPTLGKPSPSPASPSSSPSSSTPPGSQPIFGNSIPGPSGPVPFTTRAPAGSDSSSSIPSPASTAPRSPYGQPLSAGSGTLSAQSTVKNGPSGSLFSAPSVKPLMTTPPSTTPAPTLPGSGLFGNSGAAGMLQKSPAPSGLPPAQSSQLPAPSPIQYQEGMQQECVLLFASMAKELEDLRRLAGLVAKRRELLTKPGGGSKRKEDLGDHNKWGLCDAVKFGVIMRQYENDIHELKKGTEKQKGSIADLNKSMIKAGTRREEIARFNKAKSDNEFAKMLKSRTLGPEHLETQTQLRRNIRNLSTRVEQLEDQSKAHKKKIAEFNSGRPSLRAPTIDTVNRTYRNIDLAIQQQTDDVARLTSRVKKIKASSSPLPLQNSSLGERDPRLPEPVRRPFTVTPDVAATTAAALNAERYAHKLKTALLSARKEPLLNTTAVTAMKTMDIPVAFSTPSGRPPGSNGLQFNTPIQGPLFGSTGEISGFEDFPEDHFNPSTPSGSSRRGGFARRNHPPAVTLRKSPAGPSGAAEVASPGSPPVGFGSPSPLPGGNIPLPKPAASPAASFNWGPLPSFNKTSTPSLFAPITLGNKAGKAG
ncbi:hypothetical protein E1B28_011292 [Marasmius oreades]|uniref:Nucleoporin Nup159/Nup146 N-terminal domain-containing protein n=1 Tax=Marasmius oreades TaxID=181124 RepID=A0A9P7UPE5_9AGAR|nr:uncharacterized protein E1B28_011292 [Marasmius oreades]KAG7089627.1 hypothetical protein E1B28_011292 [Marasmius oreades]